LIVQTCRVQVALQSGKSRRKLFQQCLDHFNRLLMSYSQFSLVDEFIDLRGTNRAGIAFQGMGEPFVSGIVMPLQ